MIVGYHKPLIKINLNCIWVLVGPRIAILLEKYQEFLSEFLQSELNISNCVCIYHINQILDHVFEIQ